MSLHSKSRAGRSQALIIKVYAPVDHPCPALFAMQCGLFQMGLDFLGEAYEGKGIGT